MEILIKSRHHRCIFIPKYHCELYPIEQVWGHAKQFTIRHFLGLEKTIGPAVDSISTDLMCKYFRRVREYQQGYRESLAAGPELESAVKLYKSHHRVSEIES